MHLSPMPQPAPDRPRLYEPDRHRPARSSTAHIEPPEEAQ